MQPNQSMIWDGQGPVMIGRYDPVNGRPDTGYLVDLYRIGCGTSKLTTSLKVDRTTLKESCSGQRLTLKSYVTGKELSVGMSLVQFSGRTLASAFFGAAVAKAAGTVTDELLPQLAAGDYFTVRHPGATSLVIEDSTAGTPLVYVQDTHYAVEDAAHGRYRLIAHPTGHVEPLKADYAYGEYTNVAAFTAPNVERGIIFNGVNGDGQRARIIIPRVSLSLDGDFGWIGDEAAELSLSGEALFVSEMQADADWGGFMRISLV